jgi:hypothetical protein
MMPAITVNEVPSPMVASSKPPMREPEKFRHAKMQRQLEQIDESMSSTTYYDQTVLPPLIDLLQKVDSLLRCRQPVKKEVS